jgi:hypothetical protein
MPEAFECVTRGEYAVIAEPFTLRYDGSRIRVSTDDGRSAWVEDRALTELFLRTDLVSESRAGELSASALGALSESRGIEPRVAVWHRDPMEGATPLPIEGSKGKLAALLKQRISERQIGAVEVTY